METLSLKVKVVAKNMIKTIHFGPQMTVYEACQLIREKLAYDVNNLRKDRDYGIFISKSDPRQSFWLDSSQTLEYYILRDGDLVEYKYKLRPIKVTAIDGRVKIILLDDSHIFANHLREICSKFEIKRYPQEYSLSIEDSATETRETFSPVVEKLLNEKTRKKTTSTNELTKRKHRIKCLKWIDLSKTLREEEFVDETDKRSLILKRKYFLFDHKIDSRDEIELKLLYSQIKSDILRANLFVTVEQAVKLAALQCQIEFGDYNDFKIKSNTYIKSVLDLNEFLPNTYAKQRGVESKIIEEHENCSGIYNLDAMVKYLEFARQLNGYGVAMFSVKEKQKNRDKLANCFLGLTRDSVKVFDSNREEQQSWALNHIKKWIFSPNSLTLDFGDYSDTTYSVQTTDGEAISRQLRGYIDLRLRYKRFGLNSNDIEIFEGEVEGKQNKVASNRQMASDLKVEYNGIYSQTLDSKGKYRINSETQTNTDSDIVGTSIMSSNRGYDAVDSSYDIMRLNSTTQTYDSSVFIDETTDSNDESGYLTSRISNETQTDKLDTLSDIYDKREAFNASGISCETQTEKTHIRTVFTDTCGLREQFNAQTQTEENKVDNSVVMTNTSGLNNFEDCDLVLDTIIKINSSVRADLADIQKRTNDLRLLYLLSAIKLIHAVSDIVMMSHLMNRHLINTKQISSYLLSIGAKLIGQTADNEMRAQLFDKLRIISHSCWQLLTLMRSMRCESGVANQRAKLLDFVNDIVDCLNKSVKLVMQSNCSQKSTTISDNELWEFETLVDQCLDCCEHSLTLRYNKGVLFALNATVEARLKQKWLPIDDRGVNARDRLQAQSVYENIFTIALQPNCVYTNPVQQIRKFFVS